jgi:hypothetical protein
VDETARRMNAIKWHYAEEDPAALSVLQERIAETGRRERLITYSELVTGVTFLLPRVNEGKPFQIDVHDWRELDRAIVGEFLGYISMRSYNEAGFMASALVVDKIVGEPSVHFFRWMKDLNILPDTRDDTILVFWVDQVAKAHRWYKTHPGKS